jgi:hypothetical protein
MNVVGGSKVRVTDRKVVEGDERFREPASETACSSDLMTEAELIQYLRIPEVSNSKNHHYVIENLKRVYDLPRIHICGKNPLEVSAPQWFAMIANLAHLKGGTRLIHEISTLDMFRYGHEQTQSLIERVQVRGYSPANCKTISNSGFYCPRFGGHRVKAPMHLTLQSSTMSGTIQ